VYAIIMTDKVNRAIIALIAAGLVIVSGVINQPQAMAAVDWNTLGLLLGMMLIVNITRRCGLFQYVAIWAAKKVDARSWGILLMMSIVTAVFSAFLDNVTTVLLTVPVTLLITEALRVKPYPYLFAQIFASNIGGTATLIGDPPNIMIGSATGLTFNDFAYGLTPIIIVIMAATMVPIYYVWGRHLHATEEDRRRVMSFNESEAITDVRLLKQSLTVIALVILGFMPQRQTQIEPATVAIFGAAVLLLIDNFGREPEEQSKNVHGALSEAEWITPMFFLGLFILVHGIQKAGLIDMMAQALLKATGGDFHLTTYSVLWGSAVLSAFIDNIPFVATMIPLIKAMGPTFGGDAALLPLWWALSLGACLGGNGTLIGASANLVVAGLAERAGTHFRFMEYQWNTNGIPQGSVAADADQDRAEPRLPVFPVSVVGAVGAPSRCARTLREGCRLPWGGPAESSGAQPPQPLGGGEQRFIALGETEADHLVVGSVLVKRRQRNRRHADLAHQPLCELAGRFVADTAVGRELEIAAGARQQLEWRVRQCRTQ
jgi:Na+/H+ antiporter NhaD/arsenite permease-like protein